MVIMKTLAKSFLAIGLTTMLAASVHAQDSPIGGINWQVEDRFRFFSDEVFFTPHQKAAEIFAGIEAPRDEFGRKKIDGEWMGPVQFSERTLAASAIKDGHDGWAAQAYTSTKDAFTCWDSGLRRVRADCLKVDGDKGSRLFPAQVVITASLSGASLQVFAGKQCEWFIHTGADQDWRSVTQADCASAGKLIAPVNAQFSLLARVLDPASPNGVLTQVTAVYQEVQGRLVVGFGDSYGSGEGNPDYPANYLNSRTLADTLRPRPSTLPHWLDPACHRSVYSHQQRIAMQLAAENPRSVISYLGYACSGADIPNVLMPVFDEDMHVEPLTGVALRERGVESKGVDVVLSQAPWSQLDQAVRDLCGDKGAATARKPPKECNNWRRQPDLVLMSVGGNDVGFSNVVKWAVAGSAVGQVRFLTGGEKPQTMMARAVDKEDTLGCNSDEPGRQCKLSDRYASLAVAIERRLGLVDRSRVVTGPYPGPMGDETGAICTAKKVNEGADSEHFIETSDGRLKTLQNTLFAKKQLTNAMKAAIAKTGWTWVDALAWSGVFDRHGVCAQGPGQSDALGTLQLINGAWKPVSPAEMQAYASRQRWFRTFNDSVLMQFYVTPVEQLSRNARQPIDYHYRAGVSGYFHPTAEGQAVMADMMLVAARCKLFANGC